MNVQTFILLRCSLNLNSIIYVFSARLKGPVFNAKEYKGGIAKNAKNRLQIAYRRIGKKWQEHKKVIAKFLAFLPETLYSFLLNFNACIINLNKMVNKDSVQQKYAICSVPVSPMRQEPSHRTEMVSQQVFGECCTIIEEAQDHWVKIKSRYDGYEGWCQESQVTTIDESVYQTPANILTADWISEIIFNGQKMIIPMGCSFPGMEEGTGMCGKSKVSFNGRLVEGGTITPDEAGIRKLASQFLNTSYLWGGKSVFGIDCSGFTQTVFKFLDIPLLRDASLQATQGSDVGFLEEARCGDLAFFDNDNGRITHVGIMLNDHEIIHSSGKVRIDEIDRGGIKNVDNSRRTHHLRKLKRYF